MTDTKQNLIDISKEWINKEFLYYAQRYAMYIDDIDGGENSLSDVYKINLRVTYLLTKLLVDHELKLLDDKKQKQLGDKEDE